MQRRKGAKAQKGAPLNAAAQLEFHAKKQGATIIN
jgi:hypothetical protein